MIYYFYFSDILENTINLAFGKVGKSEYFVIFLSDIWKTPDWETKVEL